MPDTFLDALIEALLAAATSNSRDQEMPIAALWPDETGDWNSLLPRLRARLPLLTLSDRYLREERCGPPAWILCMVARVLPDRLSTDGVPVVYLPGVSVRGLRAAADSVTPLRMLAALQHRAIIWEQPDGRDWSARAFFAGTQRPALGIALRPDAGAALLRALPKVADLTVQRLREDSPWRPSDFDNLRPPILALIERGESAELEFKATARWSGKDRLTDAIVEWVVLRAVAAFLNSHHGGRLLIGVHDDGSIGGIEQDFQRWSEPSKRTVDSYERWLVQDHLLKTLGIDFIEYVTVRFHAVEGKTVCAVEVRPGPRPAWVRAKHDHPLAALFVRTGNAVRALDTPRQAVEYARERWPQ
ncbi:MAG: RNA-binding domain-containing protein [Chloroflexota bacterium]